MNKKIAFVYDRPLYCHYTCKHRAQLLRRGLRNKEVMPKNLDDCDEKYLKFEIQKLAYTSEELK